jgi:hypothetical protein
LEELIVSTSVRVDKEVYNPADFVAQLSVCKRPPSPGAMNHASKTSSDTSPLDHDPTSKLPSKSSQPPLTMPSYSKVDTGWSSADTRIYYTKKYRQVLSSGPACALAVIAGVSWLTATSQTESLTPVLGSPRKCQDPNAIVSSGHRLF